MIVNYRIKTMALAILTLASSAFGVAVCKQAHNPTCTGTNDGQSCTLAGACGETVIHSGDCNGGVSKNGCSVEKSDDWKCDKFTCHIGTCQRSTTVKQSYTGVFGPVVFTDECL